MTGLRNRSSCAIDIAGKLDPDCVAGQCCLVRLLGSRRCSGCYRANAVSRATGTAQLYSSVPTWSAVPGAPRFLAISVMVLLIFCINAEFFMPYYLQRLHGMSPLMAGYVAALVSIGWAGAEVYSAKFTDRALRHAVLAGPVVVMVACVLLGGATPMFASSGDLVTLAISFALIVLGAGIGFGWPHLNTFILQLTDVGERDMAASALSTVQMYAVAFGTALAGLVGNLTGFNDASNLAHIANSAIWLFCLFGFAAALAVVASRKLVVDLKAKHHESAGS